MWGLWRIAVILLAIVVTAVALWQAAVRWHPSVESYPVQGVEVGQANGAIDWHMVAAGGADFGYAVATHGANQRDSAFEANWRDIAAAGLRRGAIHVYSLCQLASDQANAFNTLVPWTDDALPAAITLAYDPACAARPARAVLIGEIARAVTMIEAHTRKPVLLQIAKPFEADYRLSEALPRSVWATGNVFPPDYTARAWRMWRASDFRRIAGVDGPVNWNVAAK